jgi:hypothetical protein
MFFISPEIASAFEDIYEPDDSLEQARFMVVGDQARQQHTLHSLTDEDWFKFYAMAKPYRIKATPVGIDIDVAIDIYDSDGNPLKAKNDGIEGEEEFFSWTAPSEGFYYVKVSDSLSESENCRKNIQYELRIFDPDAPTLVGKIKAVLIDAISGQVIEDKNDIFYTSYKEKPDTRETGAVPSGYVLQTEPGSNDLIAIADGYKSLTCYINVPENVGIDDPIRKNMPLLLNDVNIPAPLASKAIYHQGETLHIEFQASLPPDSCIHYYFGIAYPDGRFFIIIAAKNQLEPFNPPVLHRWEGTRYEPNSVLLDKKIDNSMPVGEYQLYTLRISEGIEEPVNNLGRGELSVGQFRIE